MAAGTGDPVATRNVAVAAKDVTTGPPDRVAPRIERRIDVGGVGIWAEQIGPPDAVPVLLVQRMAALSFEWQPAIIDGLVAAGYRVLTYDQRCFGWSDDGPTDRPLRFEDMVDDAVGVLRGFDVTSAHLVGTSVGGVIARLVAMRIPGLARSLTFIGSTPGDGELPIWSEEFAAVATNPPGPSVDERVDYLVRELRVMCDDRFDAGAARARAERVVARGWSVDAVRRSVRAAKARPQDGPDRHFLASLTIPTLVVHGTADPVLTIEHGRQLAAAIPNCEYLELEGMGHEIQPHYVAPILERLLPLLARGDRTEVA
jgi:pimeloyl-ACP methyl ester carboxylesterase